MESLKGKKYNRGEWAEFYVFLKTLGCGELKSVNDLKNKKQNDHLVVRRIIREEVKGTPIDYYVESSREEISIKQGNEELSRVPMKCFLENASLLFDELNKSIGEGITIPVSDSICEFAQQIYVSKPKSPAVKSLPYLGGKNDIYFEFRDPITNLDSIMGFSIKSAFANDPTIFNAGTSSQFLYRVPDCTPDIMFEFNSFYNSGKREWNRCVEYLYDKNMQLDYIKPKNPIYLDNLDLVRDSMDEIMAWCVKDRLVNCINENIKAYGVKDTVERLIDANPLEKSNGDVFYPKVVKDFLMACFFGMTAGKKWNGKEQVTGGYIVVEEKGEVLCFHSVDREIFREYLYRNTYFDYVSSKKYRWSEIEPKDNDYILPLNVSIRFDSKKRKNKKHS